jgi:ABC-type taurine transport system substrate-binding protein
MRSVLAWLGVAAALGLAACQPSTNASEPVLKIGSQKGGAKSLILASHALDGAPYRVEWSEFPSAQTLLEAVSAGAVDAGSVADAPFLFAYAAGSKIKAVEASRVVAGGASTAVLVRAVLAKETGLPGDVALYTVSKARSLAIPIDASVVSQEHDTLNHFVKAGVVTSAPNIDGAFDASFNGAAVP